MPNEKVAIYAATLPEQPSGQDSAARKLLSLSIMSVPEKSLGESGISNASIQIAREVISQPNGLIIEVTEPDVKEGRVTGDLPGLVCLSSTDGSTMLGSLMAILESGVLSDSLNARISSSDLHYK